MTVKRVIFFLQDEHDKQDIIGDFPMLLYEELTSMFIGKSYKVMNELGAGFLESVYPVKKDSI